MGIKGVWRNHRGIIIILSFFIAFSILFLSFYKDVWWDSSVYIGMGRYIFSSGSSGLWEESRPLVWPFLLGIGWLLDLDAVLFGRIMSIIFSVLALVMAYIIGTRLFSKREGMIAAFFLAFSYTYFFFSAAMLTEIPSAFFALLAFYFFIREKYFLMGIFSGIAVITRFFQLFIILAFFLAFLFCFFSKKGFYRKLMYFAFGFSLIAIPNIILNYQLYGDILMPIKVQLHLSRTTGWENYNEYWFYIAGLLKENFLFIFLVALPFFFRKDYRFYALLLAPAIHLIAFSMVRQKEMRHALLAMPFLCLLLAYCLTQIYYKIRSKKIAIEAFYVLAAIFLLITFISLKNALAYQQQANDEPLKYFQEYLKGKGGNIWITNPLYSLHSDSRVDGLLYYKSSHNLIRFLEENDADIVLFNGCDMECPPADGLCAESRKVLSKELLRMKSAYDKKVDSCRYRIFIS